MAGQIEPVSTPILTAIEPIVGNVLDNAETIAQDVRSSVNGIKAAIPDIKDSFKNRKLLTVNPRLLSLLADVLSCHSQLPCDASSADMLCAEFRK